MIQWKRSSSAAPAKMNTARMTSAPRMPQKSTRCWYARGTAKVAKTSRKTKMLSTESAFSMR